MKSWSLRGDHRTRDGSRQTATEGAVDREPVSSSTILSVGYDAASETLEIEFKTTGVYQYLNVPQFMSERLMMADSVGKFFNSEIKNAFPCVKV
jgi:hypothetical protein